MFTNNISEDWESTEKQDIFIRNYFGKGKALSKNNQNISKQIDDSIATHCVKKSNSHEDIASNSNQIRMKRSLNSQFKIKEKKIKSSSDSASRDDGQFHEDGMEHEVQKSPVTDFNYQKSKRKKKRKSKSKSVAAYQMQSSSVNLSDKTQEQSNIEEFLSKTVGNETEVVLKGSSVNKTNLGQSKFFKKLQTAKFRYLNEMLYTNTGQEALSYFQQNTDEFQDYHEGYQSQVSKWPLNPVNIIIQEINEMNKQLVIADLGCGEAKIAETFPKRTVYSFDLIPLKDYVTACDMSKVPLPSNSVDVAVFCLSLMGINWKDYVKESHRILKLNAVLKIAEIESRIANLELFIKNIESSGFSLINKNLSHKMFVFLNFQKVKRSKKSSKVPDITLKPCLYKKR